MKQFNKITYTTFTIKLLIFIAVYFIAFAIEIPRLMSQASTIAFIGGISISAILILFALYKIIRFGIFLYQDLNSQNNN